MNQWAVSVAAVGLLWTLFLIQVVTILGFFLCGLLFRREWFGLFLLLINNIFTWSLLILVSIGDIFFRSYFIPGVLSLGAFARIFLLLGLLLLLGILSLPRVGSREEWVITSLANWAEASFVLSKGLLLSLVGLGFNNYRLHIWLLHRWALINKLLLLAIFNGVQYLPKLFSVISAFIFTLKWCWLILFGEVDPFFLLLLHVGSICHGLLLCKLVFHSFCQRLQLFLHVSP